MRSGVLAGLEGACDVELAVLCGCEKLAVGGGDHGCLADQRVSEDEVGGDRHRVDCAQSAVSSAFAVDSPPALRRPLRRADARAARASALTISAHSAKSESSHNRCAAAIDAGPEVDV